MARGSTINVRILGDNKDFRKALSDSEDRASRFAGNVGRAVAAGLATVAVGAVAIGGASVKQASDLQESANAVAVTFGKEAEDIAKLAESAAKGVGLSASEFNGFAVQFSAFAENIAGAGGDVSGVVDDISKRAADFASVMNLDVADAAQLFQSGLAGETEPLRKFGIDLSAAAVEAHAIATGIADSSGEMTEAQKVQARYSLLMEKTAKTQGDFANTSDSLANQQRILSATVKNLGAKIGASLLPVLEKVATVVAERVVPFLERNLPAAMAVLQRIVGQVAAFVQQHWGTVTAVFSTTVDVVNDIINYFKSNQPALIGLIAAVAFGLGAWAVSAGLAAAATLLAIAPFIAAAAAIGALVAGLVYAYREWEEFRVVVDAVRAWLVDTLWPAVKVVAEGIVAEFAALVAWVQAYWPKIRETIESVIGAIRVIIETTIAVIQAAWETWGDTLVSFIAERWEQIKTLIQSAIDIVRGVILTVTSLIRGDWEGVWDGMRVFLAGVWGVIKTIVKAAIDNVKLVLQLAWDAIGNYVSDTWSSITSTVANGIDDIIDYVAGIPGRVAGAIGNGFEAIWDSFRSVANRIVDGWNGLEFSMPSFDTKIPGIGKIGGFSVGTPNIPRFHTGGVLPGPSGREVPFVGLGGEVIFTEDQVAALGSVGAGGPVDLSDATIDRLARQLMVAAGVVGAMSEAQLVAQYRGGLR